MRKNVKVLIAIVIAAAVLIGSAGVYGVTAASSRRAVASAPVDRLTDVQQADVAAITNYQRWLSENYAKGIYTRGQWLCDLITALEHGDTDDIADAAALAFDEGITDTADTASLYLPLTRSFVAHTLVRALGYEHRSAGDFADINGDVDMDTLVYYGYFIPDDGDKVYPEATVTPVEYAMLLGEVRRYMALQGKMLLSFGDSIMHGKGNDEEGFGDMIAAKYGMTAHNYAINGSTVGEYEKRNHIPDRIRAAQNAGERPDLILFDGGTNDMMLHVPLGKIQSNKNMEKVSEKDYSGGFERALWLFDRYWSGVPVIYVRVHDMDTGDDRAEQRYGKRALDICDKWAIPYVDLYTDTDLDTEVSDLCDRYTFKNENRNYRSDSIHPTALGYAKYYLPLVSDAVAAELTDEVKE